MNEATSNALGFRDLSFSRGNYGSAHLRDGWSSPESWGVKNAGISCTIRLPPLDLTSDKITLNFSCKCLGSVEIYFDGTLVASWEADLRTAGHTVKSFTIDSRIICESRLLTFKMSRPGDLELISLWLDLSVFSSILSDNTLEIENTFGLKLNDSFRPIFVTGIPRSGTTIVYKILNSLFKNKKKSLIESFYFLYLFNNTNKYYKECAQSFLGGNSIQSHAYNFISNKLCENLSKSSIIELTNKYYSLAADYSNCLNIIDKTPDHIFYWRVIFDSFENSKIVFCKRSSLDIFASMKKRHRALNKEEKMLAENEWLGMSAHDFIPYYQKYVTAFNQCSKADGKRIFLLDYDKFVERDNTLLRNFADFLQCNIKQLSKALDAPYLGKQKSGEMLSDQLFVNKINPKDFMSKNDFEILNRLSIQGS